MAMDSVRYQGVTIYGNELNVLEYILNGGISSEEIKRILGLTHDRLADERLQSSYRKIKGTFRTDDLLEAARKAKAAGLLDR